MAKVKLKRKIKGVKFTLTVKEALIVRVLLGSTNGDTGYGIYTELDAIFPDAPTNLPGIDLLDIMELEESEEFKLALKEYS